jgi:hypothetical protein
MAAPRTFTEAELATAQAMRSQGESWRAIGLILSCNEDTIRCQFDDDYRKSRHAAIAARRVEQRRAQRATTAAIADANARRTAHLYKPSSLAWSAYPGRVAIAAAQPGRTRVVRYE